MYTLHIANKNYSSWSLRPWVLMHEVGIPFEERLHTFTPDASSRDRFVAFSPPGTVPCLHHGERRIWDSLAITEYLAERHTGVWPLDEGVRAWARCVVSEMHSGFFALRDICSMNIGLRIRLNTIDPALARDVARIDAIWCEGLSQFGGPFLTGARLTAADAFFAPVVFRAQTFDLPLSAAANAWAAHMLALPSMQAWQDAALAETFREPVHDAETIAHGTLLEDLRAG